ncbi:cell division protein FtsX [Sulfitobacter mediterraneus]|uniref:cell division protein FtsX n=2 Tax=Roseobacteraceae TaxID=2854170 RepID=UPI00193351FB|nr:FtsX-like permease family protein [Sulfitobacter mediterraneus]UWR17300.1 cell division protein FtsX [Sulfitobacter sp. M368]MBM1634684.1 cell division protein FtsX [Sulfitobacter mediterraneus]MBM1642502.1 cell division protein FtsX [Sulfitobacter mediterraneus]MBM1646550.1 cell division protein FtsX [Sulfitobacter mediterraneus]MBM1650596.1 cell division protein FtsX [Sulfitobacter mediterraneus]
MKYLRGFIAGDRQADRVVPPSGFTAQLTLFAAAAMAFLAVFALALSLAAGRLADRWGDELARSATLRIVAPLDQRQLQTDAALRILETTKGVASARALTDADQQALLEPWFGPDLALDTLPVPRLIEVIENDEGMDAAGLRLRLAAEVPGAVLDDHSRWRKPLIDAAGRLRMLGWISTLLIAAAVAAMITLAAQAALAANAQVIAVLRLVGATDDYIAQAFIRRFTLRALSGAAVGTALGLIAMVLMPDASDTPGFLTGLGYQGVHWVFPLLIPVLAGAVAFAATGAAARRTLRELA